jgi:hypothetical protein
MTSQRMTLIGFLCAVGGATANAETFAQLTPTTCPASSAGLFTTGGQYLESSNGVLQDSWSMLNRWQGSNMLNPVSYDGGAWTDLTTPAPHSAWQRGFQPESAAAATPLTQLHCFDAGMIINTWHNPHVPVLGGAFNDMYGYAWSPARRPHAFQQIHWWGVGPAELVVQGTLAVPGFDGFNQNPNGTWSAATNMNDVMSFGSGQYALFVYIRDTAHPLLHPIALLATAFANGIGLGQYTCPADGKGAIGSDYANGVWYANTGFCTSDVATIRYTGGFTQGSPFAAPTFYRVHYTPQNLINLVNRINASSCGSSCPQTGYSVLPSDYVVEYAGVIAEVSPCDKTAGCQTTVTDNNVGLAVKASNVGVFTYTNP